MRWSEEQYQTYLRDRTAKTHVIPRALWETTPRAEGTEEAETPFQTRVIAEATRLGWLWYHTHDSRRSPKGFPDLVLCKPPTAHEPQGRLIFAELKSAQGQVTVEQARWLAVLATVPGVRCFVWRPAQFEEIVEILSKKI